MIMTIKSNSIEREIAFSNITQLCGQNIVEKNRVVEIIRKYFSGEKYQDYELVRQGTISVNGEEYGRKAFELFFVGGVQDLITSIKLTKASLMTQVIHQFLTDFDCQVLMEEIDDNVLRIINLLNQQLERIGGIELDYCQNDLWEMVQHTDILSSKEGGFIENKSAFELIEIFLGMLLERQAHNPTRSLVIFQDIDHMLGQDEYCKVMKRMVDIQNCYDIWFVASTSLQEYVYLENGFDLGITIFNQDTYILPPLDKIKEYIKSKYPVNKSFSEEQIIKALHRIIHRIGINNETTAEDEVITDILNETILVKRRELYGTPTAMEIAFLNQL